MPIAHTPCDLYRAGNARGAKLHHVRAADVPIFIRNGDFLVCAKTGGVSLWEAPRFRGKWHRLPGGTPYDDALLALQSDYPGHWLFEPACDMLLTEYVAALMAMNPNFVPV